MRRAHHTPPRALLGPVQAALDAAVPPGAVVGVACSGGPDSTALLYAAVAARADLRLHVLHVRHGLRDDAADARVARHHAGLLGCPYHERAVTVRPAGAGLEAAAREARYRALRAVAASIGAAYLLVGHTADDQAETILMNIARGTGLRGLAGMAPERRDGGVVTLRPLLRVRRREVAAWVEKEGLEVADDPMNHDERFRRVRARREILPALARLTGAGGDPVGALARLGDLVRDDADALDLLAEQQHRQHVVSWGPVQAIRTAGLDDLPRAVGTRVVHGMLSAARADGDTTSAAAVHAAMALHAGGSLHAPGGVAVTAGQGWLAVAPLGLSDPPERALSAPGAAELPEVGVLVRIGRAGGAPGASAPLPPVRGRHRAERTGLATGSRYRLRAPRPGDRIKLSGGTRLLSDVLSDAGVPLLARRFVPVLASDRDEPRWLPGVAAVEPDPEADAVAWLEPLAQTHAGVTLG